jgi:hypothetical protein
MRACLSSAFAVLVLAAVAVAAQTSSEEAAPRPTTRPTTRPAIRPDTRPSVAASDPKAVEVARAVMKRLGGREAWESTRYLTWSFFGSRRHLWDRHTGDVRIEGTDRESGETYLILMNIHSVTGRVWRGDAEVTEPEPLEEMLQQGTSAWINDSYWLVMPYKLLAPGVTLKDLGERPMTDGRPARVLELTFTDVGETPRNKYHVYVARETGLVEQWDFFADRDDAEPRFRIPWRNWKRYGAIMLSGDRGESRGRKLELTDIAVLNIVPPEALTSPAPVDWDGLGGRTPPS